MEYTDLSHFFFFPQITRVRTSTAETLEVIQWNFVSGKSFWSPYPCDGIICTEIRVQIWIKPLSEICGFLAVKGEHNRILAHMPCTSARSSAGCQHQSVHHSPPTPFHNREHTKKKIIITVPEWDNQSVGRIKKQTFKENEMPPLIGRSALPPAPPLHSRPIDTWEISSRHYWHWWCITAVYWWTPPDDFLPSWSGVTRATLAITLIHRIGPVNNTCIKNFTHPKGKPDLYPCSYIISWG